MRILAHPGEVGVPSTGRGMMPGVSAEEFVPAGADLDGLRTAAAGCWGCELWEAATQTVFSAGPDRKSTRLNSSH